MEDLEKLKAKLKEKQKDLDKTKKDDIFLKVEEIDNRKIYHTKVFRDFYKFGFSKKEKYKFYITLRQLFDPRKISTFGLFSLKEGDKFLGIFYGYKKEFAPIILKIEASRPITIRSRFFIEFRFKNGSIFCYIRGLYLLVNQAEKETIYKKALLNNFLKLEKEVYEFYDKKLPEGGMITKWIAKKQK